jgi:hypothetical protein
MSPHKRCCKLDKILVTLELRPEFLLKLENYPFNWSIMFEKHMERLMKRYDEYHTKENQIWLEHLRGLVKR